MGRIASYYYGTGAHKPPVQEFVDSLDFKTQQKFFYVRELLEEFGHKLPFPHAKYIGNEIFELRFHGREGRIRVLYFFFHQNKVIFTNGFIKKTGKVPRREIELAIKRREDFLNSQRGDGIK